MVLWSSFPRMNRVRRWKRIQPGLSPINRRQMSGALILASTSSKKSLRKSVPAGVLIIHLSMRELTPESAKDAIAFAWSWVGTSSPSSRTSSRFRKPSPVAYEEMRSANNLISVTGTIPLVILYLIGGCGFGLFFLLRHRWIDWRMPLFWGLLIAVLQLLVGFNEWPLVWMNYDTAISAQGFVTQQVMFI